MRKLLALGALLELEGATMRKLLALGALLVLAGCGNAADLTGPDVPAPSFSCAGQSGNCGGGNNNNNNTNNNNPNNPPNTAP